MRRLLIAAVLLCSCTIDHATLDIPAEVFVDGWALRYEKFLISVGEVEVHRGSAEDGLYAPSYQIFDLTRPSEGLGQRVDSGPVVDGRHDAT